MDEETKYSEKNYNVVALCYVLGLFGVHQFYLGNKKAGFLRLGLFLSVIGIPVALILFIKDGIQIVRSKLADSEGNYVNASYKANLAYWNEKMGVEGEMNAEEKADKVNEMKERIRQKGK